MVGMHNEGQECWFKSIFDELGVEMSQLMIDFLRTTDCVKSTRQVKQANFDQRRKRAHGFATKMRSDVLRLRTEGVTYETNTFVNGLINRGSAN